MFIHHTQQTYTLLISAAENLQELVVFLAYHLLQSTSGFSHFMWLTGVKFLMTVEMGLTVRLQTHQTGLDGFVSSSSTDVTLHISSSSVTVSRKCSLLQFLHHFSQNGVFS